MSSSVEIKIITNSPDTDESRAGFKLKDLLLQSLPKLSRGKIVIVCNATLFGQDVKDIDLLCMGQLENTFANLYLSDKQTGNRKKSNVCIRNFVISIELKQHTIEKIIFRGTDLMVRYRQKNGIETYHNVTDQANKQKIAVRNFLVQAANLRPYITNSIWLSSVSIKECKELLRLSSGGVLLSNVFPAEFSFDDFVQIICDQLPPRHIDNMFIFDSFSGVSISSLEAVFSIFEKNRNAAGELTRKRIELISQKKGSILPITGSCLTIFQGFAGTGKTIGLLKTAFHLYEMEQARVLILTYNHALASDLRRTIAFMNIPDCYGDRSINIQTSYKFFYKWLISSGVMNDTSDYIENYEDYLSTLRDYVGTNLLDSDDIHRLKNEFFSELNWDYVFVDEAQDWLEHERDILYGLYGSEKIAIADGRDQLVRNEVNCDWIGPLRKKALTEKSSTNLRQKSNLARFVNLFAHANEMDYWFLKPSAEMIGGRIIISTKSYFDGDLHKELIYDLKSNGNSNYDMLFLTPPQAINRDKNDLCDKFKQRSIPIWDGTKQDLRTEYPVQIDDHRLFQYDSCRGLEAWTVVCLEYDDYISYKEMTYKEPVQINDLVLESPLWIKRRIIFSWCMLPLTRSISNLVIIIRDTHSPICSLLFEIYQENSEIIEWIS